jgi:2-keto-4-pentenoate hydratase/2-oxohepta-3-ene-1,7-dioic acid hydratase in catechol pathway
VFALSATRTYSFALANVLHQGQPVLLVRDRSGRIVNASAFTGATGTDEALADQTLLDAIADGLADAPGFDGAELSWRPAVERPEKIIMVGLNYRQHAIETKNDIPASPVLFGKFNNALAAHDSVVSLPVRYATWFDYEAELVIVIGRQARDVSVEDAFEHVWGYTVGNDLSARELQRRTSQMLLGKSLDGFAPVGPWIVGRGLVPNPDALGIRCRVNGDIQQDSNTADMIFNCGYLVSYASRTMTLRPGDLIFTGTPEGVVAGKPEDKRRWLCDGDVIVTEIDGLGDLSVSLAARQ